MRVQLFKYIVLVLSIVFIKQAEAQNKVAFLEGINYQAVAIDENGNQIVGMDVENKPLFEKTIGVRFTIDDGPAGSVVYYQDQHTTNTDKYGLFSLTIGLGEFTGLGTYDSLLNIPWINGDQWLKVELSIKNDGNYRMVSHEKFRSVPYAFYTDDIADNSIQTHKIIDESIKNSDIDTGAVETSEILNETILAEDIATGAVETSEILNETILAEDIATGAVETSEILNETILAEDIATSAVETSEILDGTILNEDIANSTIDITTKVTGVLPATNGGTGASSLTDGGILVGGGTTPVRALPQATDGQIAIGVTGSDPNLKVLAGGNGIKITQNADTVFVNSELSMDNVYSPGFNINIGTIPGEGTYTTLVNISPSIGGMGAFVLPSISQNLRGCIMTAYFETNTTVRVVIHNPRPSGFGSAAYIGVAKLRLLVLN